MEKSDIIKAYLWIRENNHTIPDEVLNFMKQCAIEKLDIQEQMKNDMFKYPPVSAYMDGSPSYGKYSYISYGKSDKPFDIKKDKE